MLAAHTDTVFPEGTDLTVKRDGEKYICPGINDDTRSVIELFTVARAFIETGLRPQGDLIFCANVGEEGLGDLKGVKYIFSHPHNLDAFVSIDNPVPGGIVFTGTGSVRFKISFKGRGGHSFADFGLPNPIHAMGRAISKLADIQVPKMPKTTFNVGIVSGGTSVNTIAESASILVDFRSDSPEELAQLVAQMKTFVEQAIQEENARWESSDLVYAEYEKIGDRPAGVQSPDSPIVKAAWEAALLVGIEPELRDETSTDANIPISLGIPAITIGRGGKEGGVHTVSEWFIPYECYKAPQRTLLLMLGLAGMENVISPIIQK